MAGYAEYGLAAQSAQDQSFFDQPGKFVIQPVRVRFTFLDPVAIKNDYPKLFEKYGSYDTLGGILFEPFTNPIVPVSDVFEDNLILMIRNDNEEKYSWSYNYWNKGLRRY